MRPIVALLVVLASSPALASRYCELPAKPVPGCEWLPGFVAIAALDSREEAREMRALYQAICAFPPSQGSTIYYPNGRVATSQAGVQGASLYYPNGRSATSQAGVQGASWYYPNGRSVTSQAGTRGASVYYPNGRSATQQWETKGASWYYPNGRSITQQAGMRGASWYYANGRSITQQMGATGATWYNPDGSTLYSSGPELAEEELLDVPGMLCRLPKD
jgi:hypothetical protein